MSRTVSDLKKAVAAFMNRDQSLFVINGWDNLLQACNNARMFVERTVDLELTRVEAQVANVSLLDGADLSTATLKGTGTAVGVKRIRAAFLSYPQIGTVPINIVSRDDYLKRVQRRYEAVRNVNEPPPTYVNNGEFTLSQIGTKIFIAPYDATAWNGATTTTVYLDIFKWLPEYTSAGTENDFLLDYCFDYMMFRTIAELNYFLKEDQRVQLDVPLVQSAWDSLKAWNAAYVGQYADTSLD